MNTLVECIGGRCLAAVIAPCRRIIRSVFESRVWVAVTLGMVMVLALPSVLEADEAASPTPKPESPPPESRDVPWSGKGGLSDPRPGSTS